MVPKPMLMTKVLQLIDRNPYSFKDWRCESNCVKSPCYLYTQIIYMSTRLIVSTSLLYLRI